ncbi:hypothetical protein HDU87_008864 [Geranomyces variabilis]|uniref:Uncharacterized protein n=1 Tax=Geranomyces variabilis TaxID=109894 RepID=A0AAD5THV3_9FUNG|nr:hypothetical protein HDU87_008864 [Geranomyces variabilis]
MHHNSNTVQTENTEAHGVKGLVAKVKAALPGHKESPATTAHRDMDINNNNNNNTTANTAASAAGPHIGNTGPHGGYQDTTTANTNANSMLPGHNHTNANSNITQDAYGVNQQNQHNIVPGTSGKVAHTTGSTGENLPHAKGMFPNTTAAHVAEAEAVNAEFARTHGNATGGVMDHGQLRYGEQLPNQGEHHHGHHGHHDQLNNNNNNLNNPNNINTPHTHHNHEAAYGAAGLAAVAAGEHHHHHNQQQQQQQHNQNLAGGLNDQQQHHQHHLGGGGMMNHNDQAGMAAAQGATGYPTGKADNNLNTVHHIHHQGVPVNTNVAPNQQQQQQQSTPYMDNHAAPNAEYGATPMNTVNNNRQF